MRKLWVNHYLVVSRGGRLRRHDIHELKRDGTRGKLLGSVDSRHVDSRMEDDEMNSSIASRVSGDFDWKWWPGIMEEKFW